MNEVLVSLVGAFGLVIVALISNRGRQHAKAAREQVQNSHKTNLREELDERHEENVNRLQALDKLVAWQGEHQRKADRGFKRILRLEIVVVPALLALSILGTTAIRDRR